MTNNECELYEFSLYTIRELHTNHELRIIIWSQYHASRWFAGAIMLGLQWDWYDQYDCESVTDQSFCVIYNAFFCHIRMGNLDKNSKVGKIK